MRWRLSYYMKVTLSGLCSPKCVSFLAGGQCMVYFVYGVLYIFWWGSVWLSIVWPIGWVSHCCKCSPSILSSWSSSWWSLSSSSSWKRNTFARPKSVFRISSSFAINRLWMGLGQVFRLWNYFVDNSLFFSSFFFGGGDLLIPQLTHPLSFAQFIGVSIDFTIWLTDLLYILIFKCSAIVNAF